MKEVKIRYFASLRETAGKGEEVFASEAQTLAELYGELRLRYPFGLAVGQVRVSRNRQVVEMSEPFAEGDEVVFLPPVAGG